MPALARQGAAAALVSRGTTVSGLGQQCKHFIGEKSNHCVEKYKSAHLPSLYSKAPVLGPGGRTTKHSCGPNLSVLHDCVMALWLTMGTLHEKSTEHTLADIGVVFPGTERRGVQAKIEASHDTLQLGADRIG